MGYYKINEKTPASQITDKHLVINCRTGESFAADSHDEALALAAEHQKETEEIRLKELEEIRHGHS